MRAALFLVAACVVIVAAGSLPHASAADLHAYMVPLRDEAYFDMTYHREMFIWYQGNETMAVLMNGMGGNIEAAAHDGDPDAEALKAAINENIRNSGSIASIRNLDVRYKANFAEDLKSVIIEYDLKINGTLGGYVIGNAADSRPFVVDMAWRNITVTDPVTVQGIEINIPRNSYALLAPDALAALPDEDAKMLDIPLIMATPIADMPMGEWYYLIDPTGTVSPDLGRMASDIIDPACVWGSNEPPDIEFCQQSGFTETSIVVLDLPRSELGCTSPLPYEASSYPFTIHEYYRASIYVLGFLDQSELPKTTSCSGGANTLTFWLKYQGKDVPGADGNASAFIYAIAGIGVAGGAAFLMFSRRVRGSQGSQTAGTVPARR